MSKLTLLFLSFLVASCATLPTRISCDRSVSWKTRQKIILQIDRWQIHGAIAVQTPLKAFSASMNWSQHRDQYLISLFGPLGFGSVTMKGQKHLITLVTADKKSYSSQSPEKLLQQQLGWHIPVSNLYYWVRGIPAPGIQAVTHFDQCHRLKHLKQQGWQILYVEYLRINGIDLPRKLLLNNNSLKMKIVINKLSL